MKLARATIGPRLWLNVCHRNCLSARPSPKSCWSRSIEPWNVTDAEVVVAADHHLVRVQDGQAFQFAFEDLLIGATALHLGYEVATLNLRDFQRIPGLSVIQTLKD